MTDTRFKRFAGMLLLACAFSTLPCGHAADPIQVMTFNIRYGTAKDGEDHWSKRQGLVRQCIADEKPDLLGIQEALDFQLDYLQKELPEYAREGIGRDGGSSGEFSAILYRKSRLTVLESGTFWLSDTPAERSLSWTAKLPRICTWARFQDNQSGKTFYHFNTHWDHESQLARVNSAKLMIKTIAERKHPDPVIVTGDLNSAPDNEAVGILLAEGTGLHDTFVKIAGEPAGTFNGFKGQSTGARIDYIFIQPPLAATSARIIRVNDNGRYPSDHYPVATTISWKSE